MVTWHRLLRPSESRWPQRSCASPMLRRMDDCSNRRHEHHRSHRLVRSARASPHDEGKEAAMARQRDARQITPVKAAPCHFLLPPGDYVHINKVCCCSFMLRSRCCVHSFLKAGCTCLRLRRTPRFICRCRPRTQTPAGSQ
jgi:hypothetical protein